ncbi:MAG: apolipoprotein N-acyltransferase [Actinobacteria bacterium]|nr:apolipoprotein N-acyltransferase [Actinomycetota bacterium]
MPVTGDDALAHSEGLDDVPGVDGVAPEPRRRRVPSVTTMLRAAGSLFAGALLVLSFPPYDVVWLAPPSLALMTLCWHGVRARTGFWLGFLSGFAFLALHVQWMRVVGDDAWMLLTVVFALFYGLVGAGVAATSRLRLWWLAVPLTWVLSEAIRDRVPLGGFPWGRLAFGQTSTSLTPYAAIAGAPAVTFAVALVGALLAYAVVVRHDVRRVGAALAAVAVVCTAGLLVPRPTDGQATGGQPATAVAAVVQGGVAEPGLDFLGEREQVLKNHVAETERLAADVAAGTVPAPELVIWPENSSDIDPLVDQGASSRIQQAVDAVDVPVLVGAVVTKPDDPDYIWNTGIVWQPTSTGTPGPSDFYVKQHPVPFGEWIPFRSVLAQLIGRFDRIPRDFAPGSSTGVMQVGPARLGDLICFEVAYDELGRAAVRGDGVQGELAGQGARILAVQTNNATYNLTGQPQQQLAMSRLRAVEHGRAVLIASTSGITAIVRPDGSLDGEIGELASGYLVRTVPLRDDLTVSDRVGAVPELLAAAAAIVLWVTAVAAGRGGRRRETASGDVGSGAPRNEETP